MSEIATRGARIEPPYGEIWDLLESGEVIPFLGAGASLCGRPNDDAGQPLPWKGADEAFLPNGAELGNWLAGKCSFPDPAEISDLAKIASYYEVQAKRRLLVRRLREVFAKDYAPGVIHKFLAGCSRPLLIVTTNYDNLIEKAFDAEKRPYHLVAYPEREEFAGSVLWWKPGAAEPEAHKPSELPLSLSDTTIIYKMHGTVSPRSVWNSFVITEEDYVRFLARMTDRVAIPSRFMWKFKNSAFLFLGYGLRDWNLRVMLESLNAACGYDPTPVGLNTPQNLRLEGDDPFDDYIGEYSPKDSQLPAWAIQYQPSELERTLWRSRNVGIFDMLLEDFVDRLRQQPKRGAAR
jgi:hypothetical protein